MSKILLEDLDLWEDLDNKKRELMVGGTVIRFGENPYNGVPFTVLITPGQGRTYPNENGYSQSANAIPNAFGAPLVINGGF